MKVILHPIETPCPNCTGMAYYCPTFFAQHPDDLVVKSVIACLNCHTNTVHEFGIRSGEQRLIVTLPMGEEEIKLWATFESETG